MSETSGFFNASLVNGEYVPSYHAEHFASYFANFISNGVFAEPSDQLMVVAKEGLTVTVKAGKAYVNGYWYTLSEDKDIVFSPNMEGVTINNVIVCELDLTSKEITTHEKTNVSSILPNNNELVLCSFSYPVGTSVITQAMLTDRRPDKMYCGFVAGLIEQIDFKTLMEQEKSQFDEWFNEMKGQLSQDAAGSLQMQIETLGNEFQLKLNEMMQKLFLQNVYIGQCAWSINEILKWGTEVAYPYDGAGNTIGRMAVYRPATNTWEKAYTYGEAYSGSIGSNQWISGDLDLCMLYPKTESDIGHFNATTRNEKVNFVSFDWISQWFPVGVKPNIVFNTEARILSVVFTYKEFYKENSVVKSPWGKMLMNIADAVDNDKTPSSWSLSYLGLFANAGRSIAETGNKPDVTGNEYIYWSIFFRVIIVDWFKIFPREFLEDSKNGYIERYSRMIGIIYGDRLNWENIPYNDVITPEGGA